MLSTLNIVGAHRYSEGNGVIVGVVDTGIDATHPDLAGNILKGTDFTSSSHPDGFGSGFTDLSGHGTAMAGLIAGHGHGPGDLDGILGIAPRAKIMPARDEVDLVGEMTDQMADSIDWLVAHGADVICIAQGGTNGNSQTARAIASAEARNVVVVAGVGNLPIARTIQYPAAYPGVLAAAGTDKAGKHAAVSVTGSAVVLSAPATDVYSDGLNHAYIVGTGTSNSTAIIAGAAALVRARFPQLSAVEVIHRLTATATDEGPPGRDDEYGYGELNLVAALTAKVPPLSASPSPTSITAPTSTTPSRNTALSSPSNSQHIPWLPLVGVIIAVVAGLGAWLSIRRHRA